MIYWALLPSTAQACLLSEFYGTSAFQDHQRYVEGELEELYDGKVEYSALRVRLIEYPTQEARTVKPQRDLKGIAKIKVLETVAGSQIKIGEYLASFNAIFGCRYGSVRFDYDQYVIAKKNADGTLALSDLQWIGRF